MKTWLEGLFRKGWHRIVAETPPEKHERAAAAHESVRRRARERSRNAVAHDVTESSRRGLPPREAARTLPLRRTSDSLRIHLRSECLTDA